ncbi:Diguanylate cyclase/phosphodiesterase protein, partial [human gut metagenome]
FQPKVLLEDYTVCGFEALARWNNEKFGEVSPVKFIPLAEESKMIVPIGTFVLEEVCKKIRYLSSNGYSNFKIAVNLSEVQF